jgi:hypothetical protein
MLGPSITGASTPFAFGYALFARRQAAPRPLTYTALGLSALEVLLLAFWLVMVVVQVVHRGF